MDAKSQISLYCTPDIGERMDKLIQSYNSDALIGSLHSRGELLEVLISRMERYYQQNGEIKSFLQ